jgi:hypothetical protein
MPSSPVLPTRSPGGPNAAPSGTTDQARAVARAGASIRCPSSRRPRAPSEASPVSNGRVVDLAAAREQREGPTIKLGKRPPNRTPRRAPETACPSVVPPELAQARRRRYLPRERQLEGSARRRPRALDVLRTQASLIMDPEPDGRH